MGAGNIFGSFLEGFVGQTNLALAENKKRQADLDEYRAKKADDLKNWYTQTDYQVGVDKGMATYKSGISKDEASFQGGLNKDLAGYKSGLDFNRESQLKGIDLTNKLTEQKQKQDFEVDQASKIQGMIGNIMGGPVEGGLGKTPTANLYKAKAGFEMLQNVNPAYKAAADATNTMIDANTKLNASQDKPTEFVGGDPYKSLDDTLKAAKQDKSYSASVFFPKTDKVKASDDRHREALGDAQNLIKVLGGDTRVTNDATGVATNNSDVTSVNASNTAMSVTRNKYIILSPTATDAQKQQAVQEIDRTLKNVGVTTDSILQSPELSSVFTPDFNKVYNRYAAPTPVSPTDNAGQSAIKPTTQQYTPEALDYTAKKYGISVDEVKKRLGIQ